MANKVLKCDCNGADAFVTLTGLSLSTPWFAQFRIALPLATVTALATNGRQFSAWLTKFLDAGFHTDRLQASGNIDMAGTGWDSPMQWDIVLSGSGTFHDGFTPDAWHDVALAWDGTNLAWTIDGLLLQTDAYPYTVVEWDVGGYNSPGDYPGEVYYVDDFRIGTTPGGSEIFADDFESGSLAGWSSVTGDATIVDDPFAPPTPAPVLVSSPPWRLVVADIIYNGSSPPGFSTLTFLDHRATNRQLRYYLRQAATCAGRVSADDPEVNIVHTDGEPLLAEGVRALIGLRREGGTPPWVPRFCGIILQANRTVQNDTPYIDFTAYSPRQLLYSRPVRKGDGLLLGTQGLTFRQQRGNVILLALLARTEAADGPTFIDVTTGTIEDTDPIDINFQQGSSVGEAIALLEQTGTMDVLLPAVYDPAGSPGILAQLNVHILAGSVKHGAIMAWDLPGRTLVGIDWLEDGGQRGNNVELYTADGRPTPILTSAASVAKFGTYWRQQSYPVQAMLAAVEAQAGTDLLIYKDHPETVLLHPSPQLAPIPFNEYGLADWLPTAASRRLGKTLHGNYRVYELPIDLPDNASETVQGLLVSANRAPA